MRASAPHRGLRAGSARQMLRRGGACLRLRAAIKPPYFRVPFPAAILRRLDVGRVLRTRPQGVWQKESPASGGTPGVGDSHIPKGEYLWQIITEHYQLHQWESEDSFLRTDFNADFAKIDGAIAACSHTVKGSYTGNGSYLTVELGFRPAAVLVSLGYQSYNQPRLSIDGDTAYMVMTDSGFRVQDDRNANMNAEGRAYLYLAFH